MSSYKDFSSPIDQKRLLDECIFVVKEQSFYMKQSLENGSLRDTLKHASNMLCELRTSLLSPKHYYELYMLIFNELQHLDSFIGDKKKHKKKFIDIYESVQHAGNIIPRLYLLIIVGRNYIKNKDIKAKYILKDMTELCKGIQHPLRGLFLRYFLIQMCKDRIPDTGSEYEEAGGGNIDDAFEFLLTNFYESLKLWSRMNTEKTVTTLPKQQDENAINNRKKNLKEKMDVKMLVGSILVRMSQLEGMTVQYYIEKCLPQLLYYISSINDVLIQQYIFESVVQVFSDECHINSLEILLNAILKINNSIDYKSILITLLKRLRSFIDSNKYELPQRVEFFNLFYNHLILYVENTISQINGNRNVDSTNSPLKKKSEVLTLARNPDNSVVVGTINEFNKQHLDTNRNYSNNSATGLSDNITRSSANVNTVTNINVAGANANAGVGVGMGIALNNEECINETVKMLQVIYEFLYLCIKIYNDLNYINKIFILPLRIVETADLNNERICDQIIDILVLPFKYIGISVLKSENINILLSLITEDYKKKLSLDIIDAVIECKNKNIVYQDVEKILSYISALFYEKNKINDIFNLESNPIYACDKICNFFHLITNTNNIDAKYNICMTFFKYVQNCSFLIHLLPTIIFTMLNLVNAITNLETNQMEKKEDISDNYEEGVRSDEHKKMESDETSLFYEPIILDEQKIDQYNRYVKEIFKFIHTNLLSVANKIPILTFKLFLYSAVTVNNYENFLRQHRHLSFENLEAVCYEFVSQPLIIYEEDINISTQQYECIIWAVGILCDHITLLENENYDNIALKLTQHASKLLKKKDICLAVLNCSHLFWENKKYRNSGKVFDCLQKSFKNADLAVQSSSNNVLLYIHLLQKYIYYYEMENIEVTAEHINHLIDICQEQCKQPNCEDIFKHEYAQIVKYIQQKKQTVSLFHKITVDTSIFTNK